MNLASISGIAENSVIFRRYLIDGDVLIGCSLVLEATMDKNHLGRFISDVDGITLATVNRGERFLIHRTAARRLEIKVTPYSTGFTRVITEVQLDRYIQDYHRNNRSLKTCDYRGYNNSYWVAIAYAYQRHLATCTCYELEPEVKEIG